MWLSDNKRTKFNVQNSSNNNVEKLCLNNSALASLEIEDAILSSKIRSLDNDIGAININEVKLKISHINNRVYMEVKTSEYENDSVKFLLDSGADISLIKLSDAER